MITYFSVCVGVTPQVRKHYIQVKFCAVEKGVEVLFFDQKYDYKW